MSKNIDVFLSHNRKDKAVVRAIAKHLEEESLRVWFDEWDLTPGRPWQVALEQGIENARSIAILIGANGLGRWETPEMRAAISLSVERRVPVIPVLLPGGPDPSTLPLLLRTYMCVDMRNGLTTDALYHLECGVGDRPPRCGYRADLRPLGPRTVRQSYLGKIRAIFRRWENQRRLRRYRKRVLQENRFSLFFGRLIDLRRLYVPVKAGEFTPRKERVDHGASHPSLHRDDSRPNALDVSQILLWNPPQCLLLGEPGSGKTTLLKHMALLLASRDRRLGHLARTHVPNKCACLIDQIHTALGRLDERDLSGSVLVFSFLWLLGLFFSPNPVYGLLAWPVLVFCGLLFAFRRLALPTLVPFLAILLLFHTTKLMPSWSIVAVALSIPVAFLKYYMTPLLRWSRDQSTVFPIPVYLQLNNVASSINSPETALAHHFEEAGLKPELLQCQLQGGRCFMLLDGLDEVAGDDMQTRITSWIDQLVRQYPNLTLATCRVAALEQGPLEHELSQFRRMELQEFAERQVELFIQNWFADRCPEERGKRVAGLISALGRNTRMRLLATNPLLLSLMALVFERDWQLPERRVELYEKCVDALLEEWDKTKKILRPKRFQKAQK